MFDGGTVERLREAEKRGRREYEVKDNHPLLTLLAAVATKRMLAQAFKILDHSGDEIFTFIGEHLPQLAYQEMAVAFGEAPPPIQDALPQRLIIKVGNEESPWLLHPDKKVLFVGERWLATHGLLPMAMAFREEKSC